MANAIIQKKPTVVTNVNTTAGATSKLTAPTAPTAPTNVNASLPGATNTISKFEFRKLFTMAERMGIDNAQYHPTLTGTQKAVIATAMKDVDSAEFVDMRSAEISAGINFMVSVGLLTTERALRILRGLPPI